MICDYTLNIQMTKRFFVEAPNEETADELALELIDGMCVSQPCYEETGRELFRDSVELYRDGL